MFFLFEMFWVMTRVLRGGMKIVPEQKHVSKNWDFMVSQKR